MFCVSALEEALARFGKPAIFNTDQGCQFTAAAFTGTLAAASVRISMDRRGRWMDNVFIERLWRSLKYEDIYLKGYADGREAKAGIESWVTFYKWPAPASGAGQQNADGGVARRQERPARHSGCGRDGHRESVARMSTASASSKPSLW